MHSSRALVVVCLALTATSCAWLGDSTPDIRVDPLFPVPGSRFPFSVSLSPLGSRTPGGLLHCGGESKAYVCRAARASARRGTLHRLRRT